MGGTGVQWPMRERERPFSRWLLELFIGSVPTILRLDICKPSLGRSVLVNVRMSVSEQQKVQKQERGGSNSGISCLYKSREDSEAEEEKSQAQRSSSCHQEIGAHVLFGALRPLSPYEGSCLQAARCLHRCLRRP